MLAYSSLEIYGKRSVEIYMVSTMARSSNRFQESLHTRDPGGLRHTNFPS